MPPPVEEMSDDESTGGAIPFDDSDAKKDGPGNDKNDDKNDEGNEDVEGEEVYDVEKVIGHEFAKDGSLKLHVKWKGYEDPKDLTVEPEENLIEDAKSVVDEYYRTQGGRPEKPAKKRKSAAEKAATEKDESKRRRKSKGATGTQTPEAGELGDWVPKGKNWENDVSYVDTVHRDPPDPLYAYLVWKNGTKSRVLAETCYHKCPMKMLKFYESHLVFKQS